MAMTKTTTSPLSLTLVAVTALILAVCGASLAAADARSDFRDGINALADGRYSDAEALFRRAITERGEEKAGALRRAYLPHYYLGVALAEQNRCRDALRAWAVSESQGQIRKAQKELAELAGRKQRCQERVRQLDDAKSAAEQSVARARQAQQVLAQFAAKPELQAVWSEGSPSFADRQQAAASQLDAAAQKLNAAAASHDAAPFQTARSQANQAANGFDSLASDAQERLAELQSATSSALDRLQAAEATGRSRLRSVRYLEPYPPELGRLVAAVRKALDAARTRQASAQPAELERLRGNLSTAVDRMRRAAVGPPNSLNTAVEAFLGGDHETVLTTLEGEEYRDSRATAQACLLRAASRHALYVLGGEEDAELGVALHQDIQTCQGLERPPEVPSKFFSPRFASFYANPPEPPVIEEVEGEGETARDGVTADPEEEGGEAVAEPGETQSGE